MHHNSMNPVLQRVAVGAMLLWAVGPVAWMALTSIKPDQLVAVVPPERVTPEG